MKKAEKSEKAEKSVADMIVELEGLIEKKKFKKAYKLLGVLMTRGSNIEIAEAAKVAKLYVLLSKAKEESETEKREKKEKRKNKSHI